MYPVIEFEHLGETYRPDLAYPADHPMVVARPDLFTPDKPRKSRTPKE